MWTLIGRFCTIDALSVWDELGRATFSLSSSRYASRSSSGIKTGTRRIIRRDKLFAFVRFGRRTTLMDE